MMGPRWGRQIQVAMGHDDEEAFLKFLKETADVKILVARANIEEALFRDDFSEPQERKRRFRFQHAGAHAPQPRPQFFIWNTAFSWEPEIATFTDAEGVYIRDIHRAPVIEYDRWRRHDVDRMGRLYWSKGITPDGAYRLGNGTYSYDAEAFNRWYEQIVSWVKEHSTAGGTPRHREYYLPEAWRQARYGNFLTVAGVSGLAQRLRQRFARKR